MSQKVSDRVEMVVDIYESSDSIRGHDLDAEKEDGNTRKNLQAQHAGLIRKKTTYLSFLLEDWIAVPVLNKTMNRLLNQYYKFKVCEVFRHKKKTH